MFKTQRINQIAIKPVICHKNENAKTVRAHDYYSTPYANVCLLARKASGKSTVIYRALEQCVAKDTNVFIFSPTVHIDATYKKMMAMLKKKKCNVIAREHFNLDGVDHIEQILNMFGETDSETQSQEDTTFSPPLLAFPGDPNYRVTNIRHNGDCTLVRRKPDSKKSGATKGKGKKKKLITPEHIFVFDDLSADMRCRQISKLLTKNRHFKTKVFIACHSVNNLEKMGLSCIDYFHVFPNVSKEKIDELKEKVNITFKHDSRKDSKLQKLYDYATAKPYNFLYIDRVNNEFRKNFDEKIVVGE